MEKRSVYARAASASQASPSHAAAKRTTSGAQQASLFARTRFAAMSQPVRVNGLALDSQGRTVRLALDEGTKSVVLAVDCGDAGPRGCTLSPALPASFLPAVLKSSASGDTLLICSPAGVAVARLPSHAQLEASVSSPVVR